MSSRTSRRTLLESGLVQRLAIAIGLSVTLWIGILIVTR